MRIGARNSEYVACEYCKGYFLILLFFAALSCSPSQQKSCKEFKTGSFSIHSEITGTNFLIKRNDSTQIQTETETGNTSEWKIEWINDCEYNIYLIKDNYGLLKGGQFQTPPSINYKIIESTDRYYIFQGVFNKVEMSDTIWRVN